MGEKAREHEVREGDGRKSKRTRGKGEGDGTKSNE